MAIYMKYAAIEGAVTTEGFEKWIELNSLQWGVGRAIGSAARGSTTREGSEPSISEVTVTKVMDKASTKLFVEAVAGTMDAAVTLKLTTTIKAKIDTYLTYELTDVGISGYSISSGGDKPSESLSLNFTKVTMNFKDLDAAAGGAPDIVGYDLTKMGTV